ncbi:MAG: hypothetical protein R2764_18355 [Bacteroidales bacterium]
MNLENKSVKLATFLIALMIITSFGYAQKGSGRGHYQENREKIKIQKIAFITDKLDLSAEEAEKFWPVYNANEDKIHEMQRSFHDMFEEKAIDIDGLSEDESKELINAKFEHEQSVLDQRRQFHKELEKVIPEKKILLLMEAEKEFKVVLMRNLSGPRGEKPGSRGDGER